MEVILTVGLPGSGKSTWARQWVRTHPDWKRINRDDLRAMIYDGVWTNRREKAILLAKRVLIYAFLNEGYNIVLDDTNLDPKRKKENMNIFYSWVSRHKKPLDIREKRFTHVSLESCIQRNEQRHGTAHVPERFIRSYYNKYIKGGHHE